MSGGSTHQQAQRSQQKVHFPAAMHLPHVLLLWMSNIACKITLQTLDKLDQAYCHRKGVRADAAPEVCMPSTLIGRHVCSHGWRMNLVHGAVQAISALLIEVLKAYLEWVSCKYSVASSKEPPRAAHTSPSATTATDAAPLLGSCILQNNTQYLPTVQHVRNQTKTSLLMHQVLVPSMYRA